MIDHQNYRIFNWHLHHDGIEVNVLLLGQSEEHSSKEEKVIVEQQWIEQIIDKVIVNYKEKIIFLWLQTVWI